MHKQSTLSEGEWIDAMHRTIDALRAENARLLVVVEAAKRWRAGYATSPQWRLQTADEKLIDAVDALAPQEQAT